MGGMAAGNKRSAGDAAHAPPKRRPALLDKLRGGDKGTGGTTTSRKPSGDLGSLLRGGGSKDNPARGRGGVRTFADVATVNGDEDETNAPPRVSAGAIKRLGSVKFTGAASGHDHRSRLKNDAEKRAAAAAAAAAPTTPRGRAFTDIPMDWSIKTAAKFTSRTPMRWIADAESAAVHHPGIRSFAGAGASTEDAANDAAADGTAARTAAARRRDERLQRALCSFQHPADPMDAETVRAMHVRGGDRARQWLDRRRGAWRDALVSVYGALRTGSCPAFHVVYDDRVVLFCAPGVAAGLDEVSATNGSGSGRLDKTGFAIVTDSSGGRFRAALDEACVKYDVIGEERRRGGGGGGDGAGGASDPFGGGVDMSRMVRMEDWAKEDHEDDAGYEEEPALDDHGKPIMRPRTLGAAGAKAKDPLEHAHGAIVVRGAAAVHGLFNVVAEAADRNGGDPGASDGQVRDPPLILSPTPFANCVVRGHALKLTTSQTADGARREVYTAEWTGGQYGGGGNGGFIPPWCVARLTEVICETQGSGTTGTFRTLGVSSALNAAVAVAAETANAVNPALRRGVSKKPSGESSGWSEREVSRPDGYLTEKERRLVGAKMSVGGRGLERVERSGDQYYLTSSFDYE